MASTSPIPATMPPMTIGITPTSTTLAKLSAKLTIAIATPITHEHQRPARQRPPADLGRDLEVDLDLALEHALERADLRVDGAQAVDGGAEHRQRRRRRVRALEVRDLVADRDRGAVAVVLLLGGVALGGQALGLARLLEHRPSLRQRGLGLGAVLAGHGERVAVVLEALERVLAGLEARRRTR